MYAVGPPLPPPEPSAPAQPRSAYDPPPPELPPAAPQQQEPVGAPIESAYHPAEIGGSRGGGGVGSMMKNYSPEYGGGPDWDEDKYSWNEYAKGGLVNLLRRQ